MRYKRFPLYGSWSALLNVSSWQLPVPAPADLLLPHPGRLLPLAFRLIVLPMDLIGSAIQQVFFQRASNAERAGNLGELTESVFTVLLRMGLFPMLTLALIGEELFTVVFGSAWSEAGVCTHFLAVWAVVWFISAPLSTIYMIQEKQAFGLQINIATSSPVSQRSSRAGCWVGPVAISSSASPGSRSTASSASACSCSRGSPMRRTGSSPTRSCRSSPSARSCSRWNCWVAVLIHLALAFLANVVYYVYLLGTTSSSEDPGGFGVPGCAETSRPEIG